MLPADVTPISVDDHIIEPPDLWQQRLPQRYRDVGPRTVELDDGTEAWVLEDQVVQTRRGNTRTLDGFDDDPLGVARFSEMRPGCYDPKARLDDMDADGVWAQVSFPDFCRFAGHRFIACTDKTLATLCIQAYNDFVLDEWCAVDRSTRPASWCACTSGRRRSSSSRRTTRPRARCCPTSARTR